MAHNKTDIDRLVDYRAEYSAAVGEAKISGERLTELRPFHNDTNNSFSADPKTGLWKCFAEDKSGNFITFWAKLHGVDNKQAYKEILEKYGVSRDKPKPLAKTKASVKNDLTPYSAEQYSEDKQLHLDFLREFCRVGTGRERDRTTYLEMPYFRADGQKAIYRKRFGNKQFRWRYSASGKICLYGGWRLSEFRLYSSLL